MSEYTGNIYEIHYKLLGKAHTDRITDLDRPVTDVIRELASKHLDAVNDAQFSLPGIEPGLPEVSISNVSLHRLESHSASEAS